MRGIRRSRYLNSGFAEMGSKEWEVGASIAGDPVLASSPIVHETREHHRLILAQVPLHELLISQLFAVQPLYVPHDSKTHLGINAGSRSELPRRCLVSSSWRSDGGGGAQDVAEAEGAGGWEQSGRQSMRTCGILCFSPIHVNLFSLFFYQNA